MKRAGKSIPRRMASDTDPALTAAIESSSGGSGSTPSPTDDPTNGYVPYSGADNDVDLGTRTIDAGDFNGVIVTKPTNSATLTLVDGSSVITQGAFAITLVTSAASKVTMPASTSAIMNYCTANPSIYSIPYAGAANGLLSYLAPNTTIATWVLKSIGTGSAGQVPVFAAFSLAELSDITTVGQNLGKIATPAGYRFIRVTSAGLAEALTDSEFRTAIAAAPDTVVTFPGWGSPGVLGEVIPNVAYCSVLGISTTGAISAYISYRPGGLRKWTLWCDGTTDDFTINTYTGALETLKDTPITIPYATDGVITIARSVTLSGAGVFTGSGIGLTGVNAAGVKSPSTTGIIQFGGMGAASTRVKTVRDANDTVLELGGSYSPTGTWVFPPFTSRQDNASFALPLTCDNPNATDGNGSTISFTTTTTGAGGAANTQVGGLYCTTNKHDHATRNASVGFFVTNAGVSHTFYMDQTGLLTVENLNDVGLTASRVVLTSASKNLVSSTITTAQLEALNGVITASPLTASAPCVIGKATAGAGALEELTKLTLFQVAETVQSIAVNTAITANLALGNVVVIGSAGVPGAITAATTVTFQNPVIGSTTQLMFKQDSTSRAITFTIAGYTFYQNGKTAGVTSGNPVLLAADMTLSCYYTAWITWTSASKAVVSLSKT